MPPLVKLAFDLVRTWSFWAGFITFVLLGLFIQRISPNRHELICNAYETIFKPSVEDAIAKIIPDSAPVAAGQTATQPATAASRPDSQPALAPDQRQQLDAAIQRYFCDSSADPKDTDLWRLPSMGELKIDVPGAFLLTLVAMSLLPLPSKRAAVSAHVQEATAAASQSRIPPDLARKYTELALTSRELRIALIYAALSGVATLLLHPKYDRSLTGGIESNKWHLCGIAMAAIVATLYGTFAFSKTPIRNETLAVRLGFGSIFLGGLIGACISLPYQALRPPELAPLGEQQLLVLLTIRLALLPLISTLCVYLALPLMRRINI